MADKYYYNGVLLPEIPADVLAEYPYFVILQGTGRAILWGVKNKTYYWIDGTYQKLQVPAGGRARYNQDGDGWSFVLSNTDEVFLFPSDQPIIWSNHDIPNGSADSNVIYFPATKAYRAVDVFTPDTVAISKERLKGFADQVRRISGVEGELTPEQMETNLLNVTPLGEYPNAEEGAFGASDVAVEYGILTMGTPTQSTLTNRMVGLKYTAKEALSIVGLRVYPANTTANTLRIWNEANQLIKKIEVTSKLSAWNEYYFDTPINIAIGESFTVGGPFASYYYQTSTFTTNPKLTYNDAYATTANSDEYPTISFGSALVYGVADVIIAPVQAELPDDYQIQRTTMDDIAEEVQRLTGATEKLTTAQIQAGLESVIFQEKTVTPTTEVQEVTPDNGYYGLSKVTVGAAESIPENARLYYIGLANSEFTLYFECSAAGALQEG